MLDLNKNSGIALDLTKEDPSLTNVRVLLNWDAHPIHTSSHTDGFDLDLWAFALNDQGKITSVDQICYFKNMKILGDSIILPRDARTGEGVDDEELLISLPKLPASVGTVAIYAFIHEADKRAQHFGMIANANVKVFNNDTGNLIAQYNITQDFNGQTAVCIGNLDKTSFTPDGGAGVMDPNQVLAHYS